MVSAVLHMDEKTPHIHATVIPIVTGKRRKAKNSKQKYRTKSEHAPRLCADDVMARDKLKKYQDSYAEAMNKYGLQRGMEGSQANHISTRQFYTNAINNHQSLQEDIEAFIKQKDELQRQERDLYDWRDEAKEKFYDMESRVKAKEKDLTELEKKAEQLERRANPDKNKEDLELLFYLKPEIDPILRISKFCVNIGIPKEPTRYMLTGKAITGSGKLYSHEYEQHFEATDITLKIEKHPLNEDGLTLSINGQDHCEWFRQQYKNEMKKIGVDLDQIENQQKQNIGHGI